MVGIWLFFASLTATTFAAPMLEVQLSLDTNNGFHAHLQMTNNAATSVSSSPYDVPQSPLDGLLFRVKRNGIPLAYLGPMAKRPAPSQADFITWAPGETKNYGLELSKLFDVSEGGTYTVSFRSRTYHPVGSDSFAETVVKAEATIPREM